ncbi:PPR: pentatricopeptide repeat domain containing protein [Nitzschia inconspicua]|uniref:PPR: pentatricopeptide repeat domain containing protein n=1 Tax=Nitzschia inconspicua TaxID=303405 RepID=A0A9K3L0V6_9STRA|nr:PPR: pentatricopeptide repeat domain containing protein [Nitzschia inconspicua]
MESATRLHDISSQLLHRKRPRASNAKSFRPALVIVALVSTVILCTEAFVSTYSRRMNRHWSGTELLRDPEIPDGEQVNTTNKHPMEQMQPDDPFQATGQEELVRTLAGGPALIFEMARKSMLFVRADVIATADKMEKRWRPYSGVSDSNPSFRTQAPAMNNQGFSKSIWRNVRKRNKPSLWRHALRTYDRMTILEKDPNFPNIQRSNTHHEGAMLACAKLGLWQRALEIYHYVYQQEMDAAAGQIPRSSSRSNGTRRRARVHVTDDMVLSLVKACVRASRNRSKLKSNKKSRGVNDEECQDDVDPAPIPPEIELREAILRRIPLDTAYEVLATLPEEHEIPLMAYLVNPLAAAYQSLGYVQQARDILQTMLSNRTAGEDEIFNVHDLHAKDKGSYSLLVQGSVVTGDWASAVEALGDMTKAGLYPSSRHCNLWSEISERQTRPRAVGSWKKKRDDIWMDSVR